MPDQPSAAPDCYIVSYDHGGLVLWGYDHFISHLRALTGWLDRHPRFKSGLDNEAWMYDWLAENQPAVLAEIRTVLRRYPGRFGIASCTYGQPLAAFLLDESNIRQIQYGLETVRQRLCYDLDIYSFSEHAAFIQLPQILKQLGIRGALMRTHYLMYGHCPGFDLPIAWWEAPDGSHVPCVPTYRNQQRQVPNHRAHPAGPYGLTTEDTWILTRYPSSESPRPMDAFRKRFAHIRPLVASRIDDSGLKREALVSELDPRPEYEWATLEDVFDRLPAPEAVIAPTSEDFGTRMPWGYRGNELFDLARSGEIAILTAERLAACVAPGLNPEQIAANETDLRQAWKDLLVAQHHDIQIVGRSGAMGRERLLASLERTRALTRRLLRLHAPQQNDVNDFVAFNPLPWPRQEPMAMLPDGTILPGSAHTPSLGFAPFQPDASRQEAPLQFDTAEYHVRIHPDGGIASLVTRNGHVILQEGTRSGHLAGIIDGTAHTSAGTPRAWRTPAGFVVEERGKIGPLPCTLTWLFPHTGRRIHYSAQVRFNGERIGEPTDQLNDSRSCFVHEKKLRACFYPALKPADALGIYDVPFGHATTHRPYVEGNYWTAIADDTAGLAIFNRGTMGACREDSGAFSIPLAFSTHYIWGDEVICGLRDWQMALFPWQGDWHAAHLHHHALEFAFPIVAIPGTCAPATPDYLPITNPAVHLTAFYTDAGRTYLRLFNGSDTAQPVPFQCVRADLRHRETGLATQSLNPWEIITLKL